VRLVLKRIQIKLYKETEEPNREGVLYRCGQVDSVDRCERKGEVEKQSIFHLFSKIFSKITFLFQYSSFREGPNGTLCYSWSHNLTANVPYVKPVVVKKRILIKKPTVKEIKKENTWHDLVGSYICTVKLHY